MANESAARTKTAGVTYAYASASAILFANASKWRYAPSETSSARHQVTVNDHKFQRSINISP